MSDAMFKPEWRPDGTLYHPANKAAQAVALRLSKRTLRFGDMVVARAWGYTPRYMDGQEILPPQSEGDWKPFLRAVFALWAALSMAALLLAVFNA